MKNTILLILFLFTGSISGYFIIRHEYRRHGMYTIGERYFNLGTNIPKYTKTNKAPIVGAL